MKLLSLKQKHIEGTAFALGVLCVIFFFSTSSVIGNQTSTNRGDSGVTRLKTNVNVFAFASSGNIVYDLGRVSKAERFSYTAGKNDSYDLVFSNEFDPFSLVVAYNITSPRKSITNFAEVPFNESRFITVDLRRGETFQGNFSISGGQRSNDIHFYIAETMVVPEFSTVSANITVLTEITLILLTTKKGLTKNIEPKTVTSV